MLYPYEIKSILYFLFIFLFVLSSWRGEDNSSRSNSNSSVEFNSERNIESNENYSDQDIIEMIDQYGGLPGDPQLPEEILGATDEVLESTNPRELADVINLGISIAKRKIKSKPRLLFEVARMANQIGYYQKSIKWFNEAKTNTSSS